MAKKKKNINSTRASRDGHEYHEMWVAKKSLELLNPNTKLKSIAVEGLAPVDQNSAKSEEVEIADVALYYGGKNFEASQQVCILQFKYSLGKQTIPVRISDAKTTLEKFSATFKNNVERYGPEATSKMRFQFITNRPISNEIIKTVENLSEGIKNSGKYLLLERQFKKAVKLDAKSLKKFASACEFQSYTSHLSQSKNELTNLLISLSATSGSLAFSRIGELKDLVRNKAGTSGEGKNTIERTDVFAALGINDLEDFLPCQEVLSKWGKTMPREQMDSSMKIISKSKKPILIHAAGGVGKTVFMKSLANKFGEDHETVFFDCFGGGSYRSSEHARHQAKHGLVHIANTLSSRGLCDPILPNSPNEQALARTFRLRLKQSVSTLKKSDLNRKIYIFIDAVDNAEFAAKQNGDEPFPKTILESLHEEPIEDVKVIVSSRTHRKPSTYADYGEIELKPFSKDESNAFLRERMKNPSSIFLDRAYARSGGNARVLEYFIDNEGKTSESKSKLNLDDLFEQKIDRAIDGATKHGSSRKELTTFLAGLTVLAPPVVIEDYALANNVDADAIASMVSDLAPLVELSNFGVVFRDEPVETFILRKYGSNKDDLTKIAKNLTNIQDKSVFAARTLPDLLYKLRDEKRIYALAVDSRIPDSIESDVGRIKIKYARLRTAARYAAEEKHFDKLIGFIVEISSIAEFDQRGLEYLLKFPDLVVELNDLDTIRRIYESRTAWPGTRHACLSIIHTLRGEMEAAHQHAYSLHEWVDHYLRADEKTRFDYKTRVTASDCVSEPLFYMAKKSPKSAAAYFSRWRDWFSFDIGRQLYRYLPLALERNIVSEDDISILHRNMNSIGGSLAALFFYKISQDEKVVILKRLAKHLGKKIIEFPDKLTTSNDFVFQKSFLYAVLESFRSDDKTSAMIILDALGGQRPRIYAFKDSYYHNGFPVEFLLREVLRSILSGKTISFLDLLPDELFGFGKNIVGKDEQDFLVELKNKIESYLKEPVDEAASERIIRASDKAEIEEFLTHRLPQLKSFAMSVRMLLDSPDNKVKESYKDLTDLWESFSISKSVYREDKIDHLWLRFGFEIVIFCTLVSKELDKEDLGKVLSSENFQNLGTVSKLDMIRTLVRTMPDEDLAQNYANELLKQIELEDDVSTRSVYCADIAQSLNLVNKDEAVSYFQKGLMSADAIGSGDYRYVNELLSFTSSLRGKEMKPENFHSLSNICEINMNNEPHKFPWDSYGAAFSKISGIRGIAQLSRWDDRQKIDLSHTLLPSLIALVRDEKINLKDAIALNYLAAPAEYRSAGTNEFHEALMSMNVSPQEVKELIHQFTLNNSGSPASWTVRSLANLSEKVLGKDAPETMKLNMESSFYQSINDESNRRMNRNSSIFDEDSKAQRVKQQRVEEQKLLKKIGSVCPTDNHSFKLFLKLLSQLDSSHALKDFFFKTLRDKVSYKDRKLYIENLASIEDGEFHWFWIIEELNKCYEEWGSTSISLKKSFKEAGLTLLHQHSADMIGGDYLSRRDLDIISRFSGMSVADLTLELVKMGCQHEMIGSGAVWLSIATLLNERASDNVGQASIKKLLESEATKLGELASEGQYKSSLYPPLNTHKVLAGLVWKALGSHDAEARWRAAHSLRCFAKFGRWDILSELMNLINERNAGPFQCEDIKFYDYHARLWLLIAVARISIDYPHKIASYKDKLLPFLDGNHVLMRHFSSKAMQECYKTNPSLFTKVELEKILDTNKTKKPLVKTSRRLNSYQGRPKEAPTAAHKFYLEYDYGKHNVDPLARAFNADFWEMEDMVAEAAFEIDPNVSSYSDSGNKELPRNHRSSKRMQTYGEQVMWHALYNTAGKLLGTRPSTPSDEIGNSWDEWLSWHLLTRSDGFWQSDTLDIIPLEIKALLLDEKEGKLTPTERRDALLNLANLNKGVSEDVVIDGHWTSEDGVSVGISSALVQKKFAKSAIESLVKMGPFHVWLPDLSDGDEEDRFRWQNDHHLIPWIVSVESYRKLDEFDPYGADISRGRSRISKKIAEEYKLTCADDFKRFWKSQSGKNVLKAEIWRGPTRDRRSEEYSGIRLFCSSEFLKTLLKDSNANLIILIHLRQYVEKHRSSGDYFHSVAIVEINENLEIKFHVGLKDDPSSKHVS